MSQSGGTTPNQNAHDFGTVLVCRSNKQRPSELEMHLRPRCQKLRVVEKLGGAHFFLPQASLAVRVYYPEDVKRLDEILEKHNRPTNAEEIRKLLTQLHDGDDPKEQGNDLDGLLAFRNHFKFTAVICVLPKGSMGYFDRPDSFLHKVQQIMCHWDTTGGKHSHVAIVPASVPAVEALHTIAVAIGKSEKKKRFFKSQREVLFVPDEAGVISQKNGAAARVEEVLKSWTRGQGIPEGEETILMSCLGTLEAIATAGAADLETIPIERNTKIKLHRFFGSNGSTDTSKHQGSIHDIAAGNIPTGAPRGMPTAGRSYPSPRHPIATLRSSHQPLVPVTQNVPSTGGLINTSQQSQPSFQHDHQVMYSGITQTMVPSGGGPNGFAEMNLGQHQPRGLLSSSRGRTTPVFGSMPMHHSEKTPHHQNAVPTARPHTSFSRHQTPHYQADFNGGQGYYGGDGRQMYPAQEQLPYSSQHRSQGLLQHTAFPPQYQHQQHQQQMSYQAPYDQQHGMGHQTPYQQHPMQYKPQCQSQQMSYQPQYQHQQPAPQQSHYHEHQPMPPPPQQQQLPQSYPHKRGFGGIRRLEEYY